MIVIDAQQTREALSFERLIEAIRRLFVDGCTVPPRHHHSFGGEPDPSTLLLMPAWREHRYLGVKLVSVVPKNAARGEPALSSSYLLADAETGRHLAIVDGDEITTRRTVAASALASSFLSRPRSSRLLIVGAGRVASLAPYAHSAVRPIREIEVWDIVAERAERLAARLKQDGFSARAAAGLDDAVTRADIISAATLSRVPLIKGACVRPGTHVDLIGSFTPAMREADDALMSAATVFIDTPSALHESGDMLLAIESGALGRQDVAATLEDLCAARHGGRTDDREITVFKSVGTALEDLAAATLVYERTTGRQAA